MPEMPRSLPTPLAGSAPARLVVLVLVIAIIGVLIIPL